MIYRREIDGLRAVAILPVVFYHAGIPFIEGGFIGVDIFFVISGYLIANIILKKIDLQQFSYIEFYEKRLRRILPALLAVMLFSSPLAWLSMLPDPLENFGQSVVASVFSLNNVLLTITSGYWDLAAEFKPLLHTWSLGVEEQFYLVFPFIAVSSALLLRRFAFAVTALISCLSLWMCIHYQERFPTSVFFLLHSRAWEIGAGALIAYWELHRGLKSSQFLSVLGIVLVLASVFLFDPQTAHPSIVTLVPVTGAALILIYGKQTTLVGRVLGFRLLVGIGLISYSLYLWHHPIYAFLRVLSYQEPALIFRLALLPLCFGLAYLSWKYIEQPFRDQSRISTKMMLITTCSTAAALTVFGLALHFGQGFPKRVFENSLETKAGMHIQYNYRIQEFSAPKFSSDKLFKVLVLGDSNGRDFSNILFESGKLNDAELVYRDDIHLCGRNQIDRRQLDLVASADLIFVTLINLESPCLTHVGARSFKSPDIVFVGPKHFGYNLNAFIRYNYSDRKHARTPILEGFITANRRNIKLLQGQKYIDLIGLLSDDGKNTRIFDNDGNILSADRVHLTKKGAEYLAHRLNENQEFNELFALD